MADTVSIDIIAQDRGASRTLNQATQSLSIMDRTARASGGAVNAFADEAQRAQVGVTTLGRQIFSTSAEAARFNGVFRDQQGRLREANGQYTKTGESVARLGNNFRQASQSGETLTRSFGSAGRGAGVFTRAIGSLGSVLGALGIAAVSHQVAQFGINSVQAAGRMEQYVRATEQITGSSQAAEQRIESLIEIANLPGLNFEALTRFSNRLIAAGVEAADTDKILLTVGQTIVSLGGTAANAELAMEQLIQAFQLGKVDFRDFRTIVQQIPGFLEAMGDVHGVQSNLDGLHEAFRKTGNSIRDLVIPVFDELARRFESPPSDSYIVVIDELQNAFFLMQAAIGDTLLPSVIDAAQGLTDFFETIRTGLQDVTTLPEPIQEVVRAAQALHNGLTDVISALTTNASPALEAFFTGMGSLLSAILELAGAIGTALSPAFRVLGDIVSVVYLAIGQLAEHISILIDGVTSAVNWVSSLWQEEERAVASTEKLTSSTEKLTEAQEKLNTTGDESRARLKELQTEYDATIEKIADYTDRLIKADEAGISNRSTQQLERLLETAEQRLPELTAEIEKLTAAYGGASAALTENATEIEQQEARLSDLQTEFENANQSVTDFQERLVKAREEAVGETNPAIQQLERRLAAAQAEASGLQTQIDTLTSSLEASESGTDASSAAIQNFSLRLAELKARAEDVRDNLDNVVNADNIQASYQAAIQASDAYYNAQIKNAQIALEAAEESSKEREKLETEIFELERQREQARQTFLEEAAGREREIAELRADARIKAAERARAVEVSAFQDAARSGQEYVAQLERLATVSQRSTFTDIVNSFVEQGLSLQEARRRAEPYIDIIGAIPPALSAADAAYGQFSSTLRTESEHTGSVIGNLTAGISLLGDEINKLATDQLERLDASALQNILTEENYFQQNSVGRTLEDIQRESGEQGRRWIRNFFESADREAEQEARDLARTIEFGLSGITDTLLDIARGEEAIDAFSNLGERIGFALLSEFEEQIAGDLASAILGETTGAAGGAGGLFSGVAGIASALAGPIGIFAGAVAVFAAAGEAWVEAFGGETRAEPITPADVLVQGGQNVELPVALNIGGLQEGFQNLFGDLSSTLEDIFGIGEPSSFLEGGLDPLGRSRGYFQTIARNALAAQADRERTEQIARDQYGDEAYEAEVAAATATVDAATGKTATVDTEALRAAISVIQDNIATINASIVNVETQISQTSEPDEITALLDQIPALITEKYKRLREVLETRLEADDISEEAFSAAISELESNEASELERHSDQVLANTLMALSDDAALINASIVSIQTQIDSLGEPEAIAALLEQIPSRISEKYENLRQALNAQYAAGEISDDAYTASFSQLVSAETAEVESNSDAVLANTLRLISEDVQLIDASIGALQGQIGELSEPEVIAEVLAQIPSLIAEKYRSLRQSLEERYAAGEISIDVYNASLTELETSENTEIEQHSDAVLANTLAGIDDDVELINAQIGALELSIEQSDDPEAIVGLLDTIRILIADKYKRLRERLGELRDAEEISTDTFSAGIIALDTAEQTALTGLDTQVLNAISAEYRDQIDFIDGAVENLRLSLQLTDDPAEIQRILDAIRVLTQGRFQVLRDKLEAIRDTLSDDEYQQALEGLNFGEQLALENLNTEKFSAISAAAQAQVDFINGSIENLRLELQLADDPTEQQQILDAIKILVSSRFDVLRQELEAIRETLSDAEYERALTGLNLSEQLSIENLDTEKFEVVSAEAQRQVGFINGTIENLRLALQLSDDDQEHQSILDAIRTLTAKRFDVLITELQAIQASLDPAAYQQALEGLQLGKTLALENIETEKFSLISAAAQEQVNFINTDIENLRLSLQLTDDPAARQQILDTIKLLVMSRFEILRDELAAIRESLSPEEFAQAMRTLNLSEQLAIENIDTEKFGIISTEAQKQVDFINGSIENLRLSLELTSDPAEIQSILDAIKVLTASRFDVLIDELHAIRESLDSEVFEQALAGLELGKQVSIENIDTEKFQAISAEAQRQVSLINQNISNLETALQLTTNTAEIEQILDAIQTFTIARFRILRDELEVVRETLSPEEFQVAWDGLNLGEQLALQNIDTRRFDAISAAVQEQVDFINGAISNLELSLQLTDDTAEIEQILNSIKVLVAARFDVLIQELRDIEASLDPAEFEQALEGLQLGQQVGLRGIDAQISDTALGSIDRQVNVINDAVTGLFDALSDETTAEGLQDAIENLQTLISTNADSLRQKINEATLSEKEKERQIAAINTQETTDLERLGEAGISNFGRLADTAEFLLENATPENFQQRQQEYIDAIDRFFNEQIAFVNGLDLPETDRANMREVLRIQRQISLDAVPEMHASVAERLRLEQELASDIKDINADLADELAAIDERLAEKVADINSALADELADIDEGLADRRERINEDLANDIARVDERLAETRERISERLNDRLQDLADDAIETEEDRLRSIEDLHRDHQQSLEDIRLRRVRRQEDIELGLNRRIADIQREAARDISELEDDSRLGPRENARRRSESVADIQREAAERIEDARLRATRDREDLATDEARRRADLETDRALSIAEIERDSAERQAEILESRAEARQEAETAHQAALAEAEGSRIAARREAEAVHQLALSEAEEERVQARRAAEESHQAALAEAEENRIEVRRNADFVHQEALDRAAEAEQAARHNADIAHQGVLSASESERQAAREAAEEAYQTLADNRQAMRDTMHRDAVVALEDFQDVRHEKRLQELQFILREFDATASILYSAASGLANLGSEILASVDDAISTLSPAQTVPVLPMQPMQPPITNPSVPIIDGSNPTVPSQANRPIQIELTIDNSRRIGDTEIKAIRQETIRVDDQGRSF